MVIMKGSDTFMTIREMREAAGMKKKEFAEFFNISPRTVENWEYGRTTPPNYLLELMEYKLIKERKINIKHNPE